MPAKHRNRLKVRENIPATTEAIPRFLGTMKVFFEKKPPLVVKPPKSTGWDRGPQR